MDFHSLPLSDYQRSRILLLRDSLGDSTDFEVEKDEKRQRKTPLTAPTTSQSSNDRGTTAALYHQLALATQLRQKLENSLHIVTENVSTNGQIVSSASQIARSQIAQHRDDILRLLALSEAVQGGFTLDSYDQYVEELQSDQQECRRVIQEVKEYSHKMMEQRKASKTEPEPYLHVESTLITIKTKSPTKRKFSSTSASSPKQPPLKKIAPPKTTLTVKEEDAPTPKEKTEELSREFPLEALPEGPIQQPFHLPQKPMCATDRTQLESLLKLIHNQNIISCYVCRKTISIWHTDSIPSERSLNSVVSRQAVRLHCESEEHRMLWEAASPWDYVDYKGFLDDPVTLGPQVLLAFTFLAGRSYMLPALEKVKQENMSRTAILEYFVDRLKRTDVHVVEHVVRHIPDYEGMQKAHSSDPFARPETWVPAIIRFVEIWKSRLDLNKSTVGGACSAAIQTLMPGQFSSSLQHMMCQRLSFIHNMAQS